ncbi:MAG TPA: ABC transporter ATP-binding protein [Roseiflexaceae bacterium]|nr:ABC transporter ATP-binding protein [Roseiflexaceae bacterium]
MAPILETIDLRKSFGGLLAVAGVSLQVEQGSLHTIIGPNGAGKTTFFNLLCGNIRPSGGRVLFRGRDITGMRVHQAIHQGIGRSFQITNLFPNLSAFENVRLAAQAVSPQRFRLFGRAQAMPEPRRRALEALEQVGMDKHADLPAAALSHGDKRRLELAMLLAPDPQLLMLDEPTAGMASEQVPQLIEVIGRVRQGKTILLVEHRMDVVMSVSDRITVMHQGAVLAEGAPREIAANPDVQRAYLGGLYGDLAA